MTPKIPTSLVRNLRERRCVLFAGAGLSAWAGLPTWRSLLERAIEAVRAETLEDDGGELDRLVERGRYLELADHCREQLGPRYAELLAESLRATVQEVPEVHRLILGMPFAAWITTNYDKLLERAYAEVRGGWPKTLTHVDHDSLGMVLFDGAPFILKAHGDIDRPESIVLTTRDYREIIHANPAFNAAFSAILLTRAVLFVGYSLNDPDFRLLLDRQLTAFRGFVPDRYAIMPDIGEVEREVLWRSARIRVITYEGDHAWLLEFLRALQAAVQAGGEDAAPSRMATAGGIHEAAVPRAGSAPSKAAPSASGPPDAAGGAGGAPPEPAVESAAAPEIGQGLELALMLRGRRIEARLGQSEGAASVHGTGEEVDWNWLVRLVSRIHTDQATLRTSAIGEALAAQLPAEVVRALAGIDGKSAPIVRLVLDAELEALPWELTQIAGEPLSLRVSLVRAPIGVTDRARGVPRVQSPGRALLIGDPRASVMHALPGARREVEMIARLYEASPFQCTTLLGADATVDNVLRELQTGTYDCVHFAGHAWYDALEVYLMLADEVRLTAGELRPVFSRRPPALVFFDSHYTSFLPPGTEAVGASESSAGLRATLRGRGGFTEDLMRSGAGAFIGCFGSPTDEGAVEFAVAVHEELLRGVQVAKAVNGARRRTVAALGSEATPLLYVLSGYGGLTLV